MVFGLFSRKLAQDEASGSSDIKTNDGSARLPTPTPSIASVSRQSPLRFQTVFRNVLGGSTADLALKDSDLGIDSIAEGENNSRSSALPPPITPSPPPVGPGESKVLYDLVVKIPPKTLHTYTLAHLRPQRPPIPTFAPAPALGSPSDDIPPPSPNTITKLTNFFSTLTPPPLLHCMRCHKDFHEVENEEKDKACRIAHDDESALVTRLPGGGGYETLWGCCGQTASGDGSEGPPDGWCYEGRHTTDIKRARFREDSTIHDDKLTSCLKLNCHGIRDQLPRRDLHASPAGTIGRTSARRSNVSPTRSQVSAVPSRPASKRPRKSLKEVSGSENEGDAESSSGRALKSDGVGKADGGAGQGNKDESKVMDESKSPPKSKVVSKPRRPARPPSSTSTTASIPTSKSKPPLSTKEKTTPAKPKSISRTLLSQSHTHLMSDSEVSTRSGLRTRSKIRDEKDTSRTRTASRPANVDSPERPRRSKRVTSTSWVEAEAETDDYQESDREPRGRDRKKRRLG